MAKEKYDVTVIDKNPYTGGACIKDSAIIENKEIDFAGVIMKHPLTNEIWMRVNSKKNPLSQISSSTDLAITVVANLKKLISSQIK